MVLLTLLGLVALILIERRKKMNNKHLGHDETVDQSEIPAVRSSDDREINDWLEDLSLEEPVNNRSKVNDDQSADILHPSHSVIYKSYFCCSVNNHQTAVCSTSKGSFDAPQTAVCSTSKGSDEAPALFIVSSKSSDDAQASGRLAADLTNDFPQNVDVPQSSQQQYTTKPIIAINSCSYELGDKLGEGGFGTVNAANRLEDGLQVAIKCVSNVYTQFISIDGYDKPLPVEIALHILINQGPRVDEIIQLLDWQVKRYHYLMVLERPMHSQSLRDFVICNTGTITEDMVRTIMRQATVAAQTCCQRGVFHRDIKMENFLINPDTLKVKLIDFGCGEILADTDYTSYCGTLEFRPPEYLMTGRYQGKPATVWSLGILMFTVLFKRFPKKHELRSFSKTSQDIQTMSKECIDFLCSCLEILPSRRTELEKLSDHDWFKT